MFLLFLFFLLCPGASCRPLFRLSRYISTHDKNSFGEVSLDTGVAGNQNLYLQTVGDWPGCEDLIYGQQE
jgi:hypothetical protein